ncbi:MAG: hypothetical protein ANABAC_2750 [Anaerolineae bacterium]|nr:MAG: hypothetical protein ANABAC_2750 [Anaerolineae bacterium]
MLEALRRWAENAKAQHKSLLRVGYFGSYARGDWGVGSVLDVVLIVSESDLPIARRAAEWDLTELPVPVDVLVYTIREWEKIIAQPGMWLKRRNEVVWVA